MIGWPSGSGRPVALLAVFVVAGVLTAALGAASVAAAPGEPISFYGGATDANGEPATEGTVIVAAVDGTEVDRVTVSETGSYAGGGPTAEKLRTQTGAGETVTFHVDGVDGPEAAETHDLGSSGVFELDLTFPAGTFGDASDDSPPAGGSGDSSDDSTSAGGSGGSPDDSQPSGNTGDADNSTGGDESGAGETVTAEVTLSSANTSASDGEETVSSGSVAVSATANSTVGIEFGSADEPAGTGSDTNQTDGETPALLGEIERLEIDVTEAVDVDLTIRQSAGPPSEDAAAFTPEDGTVPAGFLEIETNLADAQMTGARFDFRMNKSALAAAGVTAGDVAMYHFDEAAGVWEELPTTPIAETTDAIRFRAETTGFSQFVVGLKRPQFEVVDLAVDGREFTTGETVRIELTVANTGGADGTYRATFRADDRRVSESSLSIASDGTGALVVEHVLTEPGVQTLWLNDRAIAEIDVAALTADATARDPDQSLTAEESPADDADQSLGDDDGPTDEPGEDPGFPAVLVAVFAMIALGAAILVWRRR